MRRKLTTFSLLILGVCLGFILFARPTHAPVKKPSPPKQTTCSALTIKSPGKNQAVHSSFIVETVVDNRNPSCHWTIFEGVAGLVEIKDTDNQTVARASLKTTEDWTTDNPVTYAANVTLPQTTPKGPLTLFILEENPSGKEGKIISLPIIY